MKRSLRTCFVAATLTMAVAACSGSDSDPVAGHTEIVDPETGELINADLVEAEASKGVVLAAADQSQPWPQQYLQAVAVTEEELDDWAKQACRNLTTLPSSAAALATVAVATEFPPATEEWPRSGLVETMVNRWCPDYISQVEEAVTALNQPRSEPLPDIEDIILGPAAGLPEISSDGSDPGGLIDPSAEPEAD